MRKCFSRILRVAPSLSSVILISNWTLCALITMRSANGAAPVIVTCRSPFCRISVTPRSSSARSSARRRAATAASTSSVKCPSRCRTSPIPIGTRIWGVCQELGLPIHFHGSAGLNAGASVRKWSGYTHSAGPLSTDRDLRGHTGANHSATHILRDHRTLSRSEMRVSGGRSWRAQLRDRRV